MPTACPQTVLKDPLRVQIFLISENRLLEIYLNSNNVISLSFALNWFLLRVNQEMLPFTQETAQCLRKKESKNSLMPPLISQTQDSFLKTSFWGTRLILEKAA